MKMYETQQNFIIDDTGFVDVHVNVISSRSDRPDLKFQSSVSFRDGHYLNVVQPIPVNSRNTSEIAIILAVTIAARRAASVSIKKLRIHTESKYLMFVLRKLVRKWSRNEWKNFKGTTVAYKDEIIAMQEAIQHIPRVKWMWNNFYTDREGYVHVYTDGACINNGKLGAAAGIGVYFENNHTFNVSQRVTKNYRQTNQVAELLAVKMAALKAVEAGIKKLKIMTDSQYTISSEKQWIPNWKKNGWVTETGEPVKNREVLEEMTKALSLLKVKWKLVPAHKGIYGNVKADKFAKAGAAKPYCEE